MAIGDFGGCGQEFVIFSYCVEQPKIVSWLNKYSFQLAPFLFFVWEEPQIMSQSNKDPRQRA
jgi:hypothetical protein